ncbi:MAG: SH3 domain-containing protein [Deltaproteobacteria bacterium]|nr:SH3 domain-containing protein [Deltaproteobacteria bacterium]
MPFRLSAFTLLGLLSLLPAELQADDFTGREVFLRVMADSVPVRAGPGGSYRELGRVGRDQTYPALDRSPDGAWYRIRLARGVSGWVLAELVWPYEVVDEGAMGQTRSWLETWIVGPSQLGDGRLSLAVNAGGLDSNGLFALRFGLQPSSHYLIELFAGQSAGELGAQAFYGAELLVLIAPWRSLVPFAAVGAGGISALPHRESLLYEQRTLPLVTAGGGLLLAMQGSYSLRVDVRRLVAISADDSLGMLTATGGVMLSF